MKPLDCIAAKDIGKHDYRSWDEYLPQFKSQKTLRQEIDDLKRRLDKLERAHADE